MDPATSAFLVAYKWWLEQDVYFLSVLNGQPGNLNCETLRLIVNKYGASRSMKLKERNQYVTLISQINQAGMVSRAQQIADALANHDPPAVSAVTKVQWFIRPRGWTMYDKQASDAVLGPGNQPATVRMLAFYRSLHDRGWEKLLRKIRKILRMNGFDPLLAERTVDKFLWLTPVDPGAEQQARHTAFLQALPAELVERINCTSAQIKIILDQSAIRHPDWGSPTNAPRLERLQRQ